MNERTCKALASLKEALREDPRFLALQEAEERLGRSEEAIALAKEKDALTKTYADALAHYGENAPSTKEAWHNLYIKKEELDGLDVSLAYQKAFVPLSRVYRELDALLFLPYREKVRCGGKR